MPASRATETLLDRAAKCLAEDRRVVAMYACGPRAKGAARASRDVDLAVLVDALLELGEELRA